MLSTRHLFVFDLLKSNHGAHCYQIDAMPSCLNFWFLSIRKRTGQIAPDYQNSNPRKSKKQSTEK
jgi:hypothetical protein